jgi:MATE family multidrug resistance protein
MYLEGLSKPRLVMEIVLSMVIMNFIINLFLISGFGGAPALGATGAAIGTSIAEWAGFIAFLVLIAFRKDCASVRQISSYLWHRVSELAKFGLPLGVASGLEMSAFTMLSLMAGRLGLLASSGYEILWGMAIGGFSLIVGFGSATSVRIGNAIGEGHPERVKQVGLTGAILGLCVIGCISILLFLRPDLAAASFTTDKTVLGLVIPLVPIFAVALLFNATQFSFMCSLRGANDQWWASGLQIAAFWGVLVPVSTWLAFENNMGLTGISWGWLVGVICAAIVLGARFIRKANSLQRIPSNSTP